MLQKPMSVVCTSLKCGFINVINTNRVVLKTLLKISTKKIAFKVFLKTQRLCTISNVNANVTPVYKQNNEFDKTTLMCQDLVKMIDIADSYDALFPRAYFRQGTREFYFVVTDRNGQNRLSWHQDISKQTCLTNLDDSVETSKARQKVLKILKSHRMRILQIH